MDESEIRKLVMRKYAVALAVEDATSKLRISLMKATEEALSDGTKRLSETVEEWGGRPDNWDEGEYVWAWYTPPEVEERGSSWVVRLRVGVEAAEGGAMGLKLVAQLKPQIAGTSGATLRDELVGAVEALGPDDRDGWLSHREIVRKLVIEVDDEAIPELAHRAASKAGPLLAFLGRAYGEVMGQLGVEQKGGVDETPFREHGR